LPFRPILLGFVGLGLIRAAQPYQDFMLFHPNDPKPLGTKRLLTQVDGSAVYLGYRRTTGAYECALLAR
jgi:hypothetical protein